MCPIVDGMAVDAANTNTQLLDAVGDDTALGVLTLANALSASGTSIVNIQREHNSIANFVGKPVNVTKTALPTWSNNDVGLSTDNVTIRADNLTERFNPTTGHTHSGAAGEGPAISSSDISGTPLHGYVFQGTDIIGVTGTSSTVTAAFTGKTASGGPTFVGVVTNAPQNKVIIRRANATNQDDTFSDSNGNTVYGRLTFSAGVWTLSYYVLLSSTETAYNFTVSSDIRYYYQEIFNPLSSTSPPPVYSEFAFIPSDNVTADVITATTAIQGKTQLASATAAEISSTGSAGTANATVANADHVHKGVHSVAKLAGTALYGDVTLSEGTGITLTVVSNDIQISATGSVDFATSQNILANQVFS